MSNLILIRSDFSKFQPDLTFAESTKSRDSVDSHLLLLQSVAGFYEVVASANWSSSHGYTASC